MADLRPFKPIHFDKEKVDLSKIVTQPYDKINDELQKEYYERNPYNYVRLILGREEDRYEEAHRTFNEWFDKEILIKEKENMFCIYHQEFIWNNEKYTRKGILGTVRVVPFEKGEILPHERTLSKPKADRLNLIRKTEKNFEYVFFLYDDIENKLEKILNPDREPDMETTDDFSVVHRVWFEKDKENINSIHNFMKEKTLVIADGHHRYETSLNYREEAIKKCEEDPDAAYNFRMATLVNMYDKGLIILPTHRLIYNTNFNIEEFINKVKENFEVEEYKKEEIEEKIRGRKYSFGVYSAGKSYILTLKNENIALNEIKIDRSRDFKLLDVSILHNLIFEKYTVIKSNNVEEHVKYERYIKKLFEKVDKGEFEAGFILNPTTAEQVKKIAQNKERMPQKSTDFYPKLISGLAIFDIKCGEKLTIKT